VYQGCTCEKKEEIPCFERSRINLNTSSIMFIMKKKSFFVKLNLGIKLLSFCKICLFKMRLLLHASKCTEHLFYSFNSKTLMSKTGIFL
jgi:hypothetical protein